MDLESVIHLKLQSAIKVHLGIFENANHPISMSKESI